MRKFLFCPALIICLFLSASAQEKPISQNEYVKMLYALQKSPETKTQIVDALRKRGIEFEVTDGIRSLTRTKGSNDDDLKRALEEADRRRKDPVGSKLPAAA